MQMNQHKVGFWSSRHGIIKLNCQFITLVIVDEQDSPCIDWHLFVPLGTSWDSYTVTPVDSPEGGKAMQNFLFHHEHHNQIHSIKSEHVLFSSCACCSHLFVDLICIQCFPVGISARVKRAHKLIVVNVAVAVHVEDVCHCIHLQGVGGEFYSGQALSQGY